MHDSSPDPATDSAITQLLERARNGDAQAEARLAEALSPKLRRIAEQQLKRQPDSLLESVALINEAWVRLCGKGLKDYEGRVHFLRAATRSMRSVLVDRARQRAALKRGGGALRRELDEDLPARPDRFDELLAIDEAISGLPAPDAELAEMRLFAGLSCEDVAELTGESSRSVARRWKSIAARIKRTVTD